MALTGLFLCLFLVGHLAGNLQLFIGGEDGKLQFNEYAQFMTTNPLVMLLSYVTYAGILFHAIDGILLTVQNRRSRPVGYARNRRSVNSGWASRNMALLGTVLLVFIATHMTNFWGKMHFATIPMQGDMKDLHTVVLSFFNPEENNLALVAAVFYSLSMLALGFHLWHGFQSAFQSLGVNHPNYTPIVKKLGYGFSVLVPTAFAVIPLYLYFTQA